MWIWNSYSQEWKSIIANVASFYRWFTRLLWLLCARIMAEARQLWTLRLMSKVSLVTKARHSSVLSSAHQGSPSRTLSGKLLLCPLIIWWRCCPAVPRPAAVTFINHADAHCRDTAEYRTICFLIHLPGRINQNLWICLLIIAVFILPSFEIHLCIFFSDNAVACSFPQDENKNEWVVFLLHVSVSDITRL